MVVVKTNMSAEAKLKELGLLLPTPPVPVASYLPWRRAGQLLYLSGQGPRDEAGKISVGRLGRDCSVERGYADARRVGLQLLSSIRAAIGSLDHVEAVIKLLGMVNAEPDFGEQPQVINGCSDVLIEVLGERGKHARSAVGMGSLPNAMTVEVEVIILIKDGF
jgi:enamine deaminase RidA (YjgF/YER057c/UK114 family)